MNISYLLKYQNIKHYSYPFPAGRLYIFGDEKLIRLIAFGHEFEHAEVEGNFKESAAGELGMAVKFFDNYLLGKESPLPELDLSPFTRKEIRVYDNLKRVPFGRTVTYAGLANKSGIPGGARFVGNAMAKNYFPIFIPCHRVIKSGGSPGNFSAGRATKFFLLQHEQVFSKK